VWNGPHTDPARYVDLLHLDCVLTNPLGLITPDGMQPFMAALLAVEPDIRVVPLRWAETADGVLIEWANRGTLRGAPVELRGVDRFTLRNGKVAEGVSYFDPRPFLDA